MGRRTTTDDSRAQRLGDLLRAALGSPAGPDDIVHVDRMSRLLYATDASIYQSAALAIVEPRDARDVAAVLAVARARGVAIVPRGGGTSLAGQCVGGEALVVDFSRHMRRLLAVDRAARRVRVEPGLVRDELNAALVSSGLHFAPETATSDRACIGGMLGNNSAGTRSIRYGQTRDHVERLDVLLASGERLVLERLGRRAWQAKTQLPGREGEIYRGVSAITERLAPEIRRRFPKVMRRVAGYRLDALIGEPPWSLADLVVGSEGTLCSIVAAELRLEPLPAAHALVVICFETLDEALRATPRLVEADLPSGTRPSAIELLDHTVLAMARRNPGAGWRYRWLASAAERGARDDLPAAVLIIEVTADDELTLSADIAALAASELGSARRVARGPDESEVWDVRRSGLGLLAAITADRRPVALIEDAAVPVETLADYIADIRALCDGLGVELSLYAHASVGLLHVRPLLDLRSAHDIDLAKRISAGALELTLRHRGSFSGEHGDGRLRSAALEPFYGPVITRGFAEIKQLFDPQGLMNPGVIVAPRPIDADLRLGSDYAVTPLATRYHYREAGSLATAVELCTGVGACRKTASGSMCPSYMATRDERDTTRARANALRLAISGQLGPDALAGDDLADVFDLCLGCKACKAECPSNVDVARLKSELLAARHDVLGATASERFFGFSAWAAALSSGPLAALANHTLARPSVRALLEHTVGLDRRRALPTFATQTLSSRFRRRRARSPASPLEGASRAATVALFADTYSEHHEPHIGEAALDVIEALGYRTELVAGSCCARPLISNGFLDEARRVGRRTLERIARLPPDVPLVVVEPGCHSALVDDLPDLVDDVALGRAARERIVDIATFIKQAAGINNAAGIRNAAGIVNAARVANAAGDRRDRSGDGVRFVIHPHCHERALVGASCAAAALVALGGSARSLDAGCCGMAGGFGYHHTHYDVSRAVAEDRLLPAARALAPDEQLVASGFSCRHQLGDFAGLTALHLVEAAARLLSC